MTGVKKDPRSTHCRLGIRSISAAAAAAAASMINQIHTCVLEGRSAMSIIFDVTKLRDAINLLSRHALYAFISLSLSLSLSTDSDDAACWPYDANHD